jgi:hypothetical protein
MQFTARGTHHDVTFDLAEVPDAALEGLLDALQHGHPINYAVVEAIIRAGRKPQEINSSAENMDGTENTGIIKLKAQLK